MCVIPDSLKGGTNNKQDFYEGKKRRRVGYLACSECEALYEGRQRKDKAEAENCRKMGLLGTCCLKTVRYSSLFPIADVSNYHGLRYNMERVGHVPPNQKLM